MFERQWKLQSQRRSLQMKDIDKFCTYARHFSVFQVDPTFDLRRFSITATQYKHLLLVNRQSGKHPVMVGPLLVHQKKESYLSSY